MMDLSGGGFDVMCLRSDLKGLFAKRALPITGDDFWVASKERK
jgi:hypothetical protein